MRKKSQHGHQHTNSNHIGSHPHIANINNINNINNIGHIKTKSKDILY